MKTAIKPKILFILPSLGGGGAERTILNLINNLDRQRFKPQLAVLNLEGEYLDLLRKDIKVFDLKKSRARYAILELTKLINKEKPNIVLGTIVQIRILLHFVKKLSRHKPIFITRCENFQSKTEENRIIKFLSDVSLRTSDYIITISRGIAKDLIEHHDVKEEKIRIIYNPINLENVQKLAKKPLNHPWFLSQEPVIIAVGRLTKQKGFSYLIKALFLIHPETKAKLVILGQGPEKEKLKELSKQLNIEKEVEFLGFQKNPYRFITQAKVFVLSSLWEGFGNVIIEAMACGCPVVSTNCQSGPSEILENGKYGILVPIANSKSLAGGILKLLDNSKLRKELSEKGRQKVKDFDIKKIVKEYQDLFFKILENKNG